MPVFQTPDFLQFAKDMPEESPLGAAVTGGLQGFSDVQKLQQRKQQMELEKVQLGEEQLKAKALPEDIAQKQELQRQAVSMGKMEEAAKPLDIQQTQQKAKYDMQKAGIDVADAQMLHEALPEKIRQTITKGRLDILHQQNENEIGNIDIDKAKEGIIDTELAKIHYITDPQKAASAYNIAAKKAQIFGVSIPQQYDKNLVDEKWLANPQYGGKIDDYLHKLGIQRVIGEYKVSAAQIAALNKNSGADEFAKKQADAYVTYSSDLNDQADAASDILQRIDNVENDIRTHPDAFGKVAGIPIGAVKASLTGGIGAQVDKDVQAIVIDKEQLLKGSKRASKALIEQSKRMKPNPLYDSKETTYTVLDRLRSDVSATVYERDFNNMMSEGGVRNDGQVRAAWTKFQLAMDPYIKKGYRGKELYSQWFSWFQKHQDVLPSDFQKLHGINPNTKYSSAPASPESIIPAYNNKTPATIYGGF